MSDVDNTTQKQRGGITGKGFMPGQSGNPEGRPKGSTSIKDAVRKHLEDNPNDFEEFVKHFIEKNRELAWQMLEGKPPQDIDLGNKGELPFVIKIVKDDRDKGKDN